MLISVMGQTSSDLRKHRKLPYVSNSLSISLQMDCLRRLALLAGLSARHLQYSDDTDRVCSMCP